MVEVVEYWVKGIVEGYVFEVDIGSNCVVIEEESSIIGNVEYVIFKQVIYVEQFVIYIYVVKEVVRCIWFQDFDEGEGLIIRNIMVRVSNLSVIYV